MHTYEQLTGKLRDGNDYLIGIGYSGKGADKNNPASEGKHGLGPLPCGRYKIVGPPIDTPKHGPYVLRLLPDAATRARIVALGRDPDSFRMHGDSKSHPGEASEGCMIQALGVRQMTWACNATDPDLEVVSGITPPVYDGEISI